ncbi:unnamed protein product [Parajaminaea phylloscopi]
MSKARQRSQRKASSIATTAITLQSTDTDGAGTSIAGPSLISGSSRPLTIKERQQIEEEEREREDRARQTKRRKLRKRLDELERTNYRDALSSARSGADWSSRSEDGGFAIPNSAVEEAVARRRKQLGLVAVQTKHTPASEPATTGSDEGNQGKSGTAGRRKPNATVKRLMSYRRGFYAMLEDAASDEVYRNARFNYQNASAALDLMAAAYEAAREDIAGTNRRRKDQGHSALPLPGLAYPTRPLFCTICGDGGSTNCPRCGDRTCTKAGCLETHNDARCDRPIR